LHIIVLHQQKKERFVNKSLQTIFDRLFVVGTTGSRRGG